MNRTVEASRTTSGFAPTPRVGGFDAPEPNRGTAEAPPFDAITTSSLPSRKNVSVVVRALPDRRPVVVSKSTGIPATERGTRPFVTR